ncbi:MAG: VOC family protein [Candidatus Hydrogenedentes bacterium]|nr:VOC family protein [Candidatus Hydrogenedentota bacterium]
MADLAVEQGVVPALRITDYEASKRFYVDGLGFAIDWEHRFEPHFPVFAQLSRGSLVFYITQHAGDCQRGGLIHLFVPDVDAWHGELRSRGVAILQAPEESIPGLRDMTVRDPDGNTLRICQRV